MNSTQQAVDFLGHQINCVQDADGTPYVPLKWLCEILGIDDRRQRRDVKDSGVYDWKMLSVKGADGRHRNMFCLPLKKMDSWMRRADPDKVRPEMIQKLLEYRDESETAMIHFVNGGIIIIDPRVRAEEVEAVNRALLEKRMERILVQIPNPVDSRFELLQTELALFRQVPYESERYNDKVRECMTIAINEFKEWLANFGKDSAPDSKLSEKLEEVRSLEEDYRDLHSVKDDLFELCNRLKDREPELCDQLWQFCCRLHERCEANFSVIIDLKEDIGCRYYWQAPYEDLYNALTS